LTSICGFGHAYTKVRENGPSDTNRTRTRKGKHEFPLKRKTTDIYRTVNGLPSPMVSVVQVLNMLQTFHLIEQISTGITGQRKHKPIEKHKGMETDGWTFPVPLGRP
jgi:hypothetical protein